MCAYDQDEGEKSPTPFLLQAELQSLHRHYQGNIGRLIGIEIAIAMVLEGRKGAGGEEDDNTARQNMHTDTIMDIPGGAGSEKR